jgi:hypothetical protein
LARGLILSPDDRYSQTWAFAPRFFCVCHIPMSHPRIFGDLAMGKSAQQKGKIFPGVLAIVILIAVVAAQVNCIAMYGINNRYWPRHLTEEARAQYQRGEYVQAAGTYVRAYTLALEGEVRLFLVQPIMRLENSITDPVQYEQALKLCRLASRLAGRHDPEGVIGSRCATLQELIAIRDCERSCFGKCNIIIDGEYTCNDDS